MEAVEKIDIAMIFLNACELMDSEVNAREQTLKHVLSQCTRMKALAHIEEMRLRQARAKRDHVHGSIVEYQNMLNGDGVSSYREVSSGP